MRNLKIRKEKEAFFTENVLRVKFAVLQLARKFLEKTHPL